MSPSTGPRAVAILSGVLASPRFASALTTATVGTAVFSELLQRLIGWPGYLAVLMMLVALSSLMLVAVRAGIEWNGLLPVSLLAFIGWASLSIIWSQYQWTSLGGISYLLAYTLLALTIALTRDTIQIVRVFGDVFRVVLGVSFGIEIISGALIDTAIPFLGIEGNFAEFGPLQGVMGSRNQFGLLAVLALITFGMEFATRSVSRTVAIGSLAVAALGVAFSRSPVTVAVLVLVLLAVPALYLLRKVSAERRTTWQLSILAVGIVLAVVTWVFRSRVSDILSANSEISYRLTLWRGLWNLIDNYRLQGWGWTGAWRPDVQPFPIFAINGQREPTSALNAYIDVWFQLGLVGIFIFGVLVALAFTRSRLLAGRERSIIYTWPALVLVALIATSLAESSMLVEYGWLTFVICCVKAAQKLSWRRAFSSPVLSPELP